jgi:hypothetical protein
LALAFLSESRAGPSSVVSHRPVHAAMPTSIVFSPLLSLLLACMYQIVSMQVLLLVPYEWQRIIMNNGLAKHTLSGRYLVRPSIDTLP